MKKIVFNQEYVGAKRDENVMRALGGEDFLQKATLFLAQKFEGKRVFLTASATTALEVAFLAAELPRDSEVLMPSLTFPSVGNIIVRSGLVPVFCEVNSTRLTLDLNDVRKKISNKTAGVVVAHYGGVSCDMDELGEICDEYGLMLFEDGATAFDAFFCGQALGTFGDAGVFSFHATKNVSAEQGGALLVDEKSKLLLQIEQAYEDGTNRLAFLRGEVPFYEWTALGTNVRMTNLNAAVLLASLEEHKKIRERRRELWKNYEKLIEPLALKYPVIAMEIPETNDDNGHVFWVRFENMEIREKVRLGLLEKGIEAHFHYMPLHCSLMGKNYAQESLDLSEEIADSLLRLPLHSYLTIEDVESNVNVLESLLEEIYE